MVYKRDIIPFLLFYIARKLGENLGDPTSLLVHQSFPFTAAFKFILKTNSDHLHFLFLLETKRKGRGEMSSTMAGKFKRGKNKPQINKKKKLNLKPSDFNPKP